MARRLPPNSVVQFRKCPVCRRTLACVCREFGSAEEALGWLPSDRPAGPIPVSDLPRSECGRPGEGGPATHIALYVDGRALGPPVTTGRG